MSEQSARFDQAAGFFGSVIAQVGRSQWADPTPCTEWSVRQLMNHVVVEQLWVPPLLVGKTVAEVGTTLDGDKLGAEPLAAWKDAAAESRACFGSPTAMAGTVHLSYGDDSVANYCDQMTLDALVHGWDLARAIGVDESLPTNLVQWAYDAVLPMQEMLEGTGMFGTRVLVTDSATQQAKLLAMLGRQG